jgi:hypothetical protein
MANDNQSALQPVQSQSSLARKLVVAVLIVAAFALVIFLGLR